MPQLREHLLEDAAVGGVVVHDQHAAGRAGRPARPARLRAGALGARPKRAVKWNVLPWPDLALDPDPAAHQLDQLRARSPAPGRCRRTCASSSCRPARTPRRSACCLSGGMPMPVSRDREVQATLVRRLAPRRSTRDDHLALLGELDGVADQVDERPAAAGPGRRPGASGTSGATWQASSSPFSWARRASVFSVSPRRVAQVERRSAPGRACRPRSWRSRGCR